MRQYVINVNVLISSAHECVSNFPHSHNYILIMIQRIKLQYNSLWKSGTMAIRVTIISLIDTASCIAYFVHQTTFRDNFCNVY